MDGPGGMGTYDLIFTVGVCKLNRIRQDEDEAECSLSILFGEYYFTVNCPTFVSVSQIGNLSVRSLVSKPAPLIPEIFICHRCAIDIFIEPPSPYQNEVQTRFSLRSCAIN